VTFEFRGHGSWGEPRLGAVLEGDPTYIRRGSSAEESRLDGLELSIEVGEIGDEVTNDVGVRERVDLDILAVIGDTAFRTHVSSWFLQV